MIISEVFFECSRNPCNIDFLGDYRKWCGTVLAAPSYHFAHHLTLTTRIPIVPRSARCQSQRKHVAPFKIASSATSPLDIALICAAGLVILCYIFRGLRYVGILEIYGLQSFIFSQTCIILAKSQQPKYWCKHCKTFVRDTKVEKTNHEATPKHQGNLKRFLRDLHRGHEREERDAQRAKDEVARLNGVVSSPSSAVAGDGGAPWRKKPATAPANSTLRQATPADRKQQLRQLAEMGVAIPEEFRREMAMAGDWQTLSERAIYDDIKEDEDRKDFKPKDLSAGVRKRKYEGQEEEEAEESVTGKAWGSTTRTYPITGGDGQDDLDSLLAYTKVVTQDGAPNEDLQSEKGSAAQQSDTTRLTNTDDTQPSELPSVKKEDFDTSGILSEDSTIPNHVEGASTGTEDGLAGTGIVFKKRKAKQIRQR